MAIDYRKLFATVRCRIGMYFMVGSYVEVVAFVIGCDAANASHLLHGLNEWLIVRHDRGGNLFWGARVLSAAFPSEPHMWNGSNLTTEQNAKMVDAIFDLLDQFLCERDKPGGLKNILAQYAAREARQGQDDDSHDA